MSTALKLSDLLARGVRVEWHEGVALVRAVVEHVLEHASASPRVPELSDIALSAGGEIALLGGAAHDEPVRRLGQLLQVVLGQSEPPVQLRLVIAQATSPDPAFSSLREYHDSLGYFERPDRTAVLQALFARATAAPAPISAPPHLPTLDAIAPLAVGPARVDPQTRSKPKTRLVWLAGSAAMLGLACLAGVVYAKGSGAGDVGGSVSAMALEASDTMGSAVVSGVSAVTERVGLGRLVPADAPTVLVSSVKAASPARARVRRAAPVRIDSPAAPIGEAPPFLAYDLDGIAAFFETVDVNATTPEDADNALHSNDPGTVIYSADSAGVSPPLGVRPQLPRDLPANVQREHLTRIELLISTDGVVESVKLHGEASVPEAMLLSAAKAWQFEPALKDGFPVRYRKTVWITPQQ